MIQQQTSGSIKPVLPYLFFYLLVFAVSAGNPFFWDAIYFSKIAHWYNENGLNKLILPTDLDTGHPPFFGVYLLAFWKLFGKNLFVSHLAVLPFVLGTIWQIYILARRFFAGRQLHIVMVFICLEPSFLAHSTIPSNDLVLVFFYLLALNSVIKNQRFLLFLAMAGMSAVSLRGIVCVAAIFLTEAAILVFNYHYYSKDKTPGKNLKLFSFLLPYSGVGILVAAWLFYHFQQTGWVASTPSENWSGGRQALGLAGYLKNIVVIKWRFLDYGRIGLWICAGIAAWFCFKNQKYNVLKTKNLQLLLIFAFIPAIVLSLSFIPFSNPIGHRYYLVSYLFFTLVAIWLILNCTKNMTKQALLLISALSLITGHLWVYPAKTAQGWDSTLAHIPYFQLRKSMNNFVFENKIEPSAIGTAFPNIDGTRFTDLDDTDWKFIRKNLKTNKYIIQSNIFNDFTDEEIQELEDNWFLEKEFRSWNGVYVRLYRK